MIVFLVGYAGSGKSSLGKRLQRALGLRLVDTDKLVERSEGATVAEISRAMNRMHEYKVGLYQRAAAAQSWERLRAAIALCGETDAALKSSMQSGYLPLERLICAL